MAEIFAMAPPPWRTSANTVRRIAAYRAVSLDYDVVDTTDDGVVVRHADLGVVQLAFQQRDDGALAWMFEQRGRELARGVVRLIEKGAAFDATEPLWERDPEDADEDDASVCALALFLLRTGDEDKAELVPSDGDGSGPVVRVTRAGGSTAELDFESMTLSFDGGRGRPVSFTLSNM